MAAFFIAIAQFTMFFAARWSARHPGSQQQLLRGHTAQAEQPFGFAAVFHIFMAANLHCCHQAWRHMLLNIN
jgi:hypothetical protein